MITLTRSEINREIYLAVNKMYFDIIQSGRSPDFNVGGLTGNSQSTSDQLSTQLKDFFNPPNDPAPFSE